MPAASVMVGTQNPVICITAHSALTTVCWLCPTQPTISEEAEDGLVIEMLSDGDADNVRTNSALVAGVGPDNLLLALPISAHEIRRSGR